MAATAMRDSDVDSSNITQLQVMCRSAAAALIVFVASLVVSSCSLMGEDADRLRVTPHPEEFDQASDDTLFALLTNIREPDLYYVCYPDIWLEQSRDGEVIGRWKVRGDEKCGSVGQIQIGQSRSFSIPVPPGLTPYPRHVDLHYRLETRLYRNRDGCDVTDPVIARSHSFKVINSGMIID